MSLGVRIFLVYFLFVGLTAWFVLGTVRDEIKPGVRQSTEETMVDTAYLLAELLQDDLKAGTLAQSRLPELLRAYGKRQPNADIWGLHKQSVNHRIYVTDERGRVILDSDGQAVGLDYSRWNDVYRTLRGEYGARSSVAVEGNESTTVMYVAAPIHDGERIIGVVSVGKPNSTVQPYIDRSSRRLMWSGLALLVLGLTVGGLLSWWLSRALGRLTSYARDVSEGQRAQIPQFHSSELGALATAMDSMRRQLDGKAYVENYVQTLSHELKSPLAAIRGAAELLRGDLSEPQRQHFVGNVESESLRMQQLIERLLGLARLEQRAALADVEDFALRAVVDEWFEVHGQRLVPADIRLDSAIEPDINVCGERLLLGQAVANLLENAMDFTPPGGQIRLTAVRETGWVKLCIYNEGDPIPDFALPRLVERFYSLPRPATGRKSTGLGLRFVTDVATLHGGGFTIANVAGGVEACLTLPAA